MTNTAAVGVTVAEVMSRDLVTVQPETSLDQAVRLMADHHVSGLPVVNEAGNLAGVLSETDLMWQQTGAPLPTYIMLLDSVIYLKNPAEYSKELHKALGQRVQDVMTDKVITARPDWSLQRAAQVMHEHQVRRLPVVTEAGQLAGILTRGDIVREMAAIAAPDADRSTDTANPDQ